MSGEISKDNHYLAQSYLKQWGSNEHKVWFYRTLVSHESVPFWQEGYIKWTAFYTHLYSRVENGIVTDEIEHWFNTNFEIPAMKVLGKVFLDAHLKPSDWQILVSYLALHDLRTPARLQEYLERAPQTTKKVFEDLINKFPNDLKSLKDQTLEIQTDLNANRKFPFKITPLKTDSEDIINLKIETDIGRSSWLDVISHQLENSSKVLQKHKWTILKPSNGQKWFTTDKPVMRLNFYRGKYDFKGGWNSKGTEIFFPLSPEHILYCKIGSKPPLKGTRLSNEKTSSINKLIIEHSYRFVFFNSRADVVKIYKPRIVNHDAYTKEKEFWTNWHEVQSDSEKFYF